MKKPGSKAASKTHRTFTLEPYNPNWPHLFDLKAAQVKQILDSEVIAIEHIGSTSILDMWAKPQIDILVTVKDLGKIKNLYSKMEQAGFTPHGDYTGEGEEYFSEDSPDGKRQVSIHIMPQGHAWAEEMITFRDYLRAHPKERDYYSNSKRRFAQEYQDNYEAYFLHKRGIVHALRDNALKWKSK